MKRSLVFGSLVMMGVLTASVMTYRTSLNRAEPQIAQYSPGALTANPFTLTGIPGTGPLHVYVAGIYTFTFNFTVNGAAYSNTGAGGSSFQTAFSVKPGDAITVSVIFSTGQTAYGWVPPTDQAARYCPGAVAPLAAAAQAAGETVISQQCWNDDGAGDDAYDDFELVFAQKPAASPSPSPSPSPSASPSPSPSASPSPSPSPSSSPAASPSPSSSGQGSSTMNNDQAQFQVRPFNDVNRNGFRDESETAINGVEFKYKVMVNSDPPYDYTVDDGADGRIVTLGKGAKLTVEQVDKPGWVRTTPQTVVTEMTESRLYKVDFGNYNPLLSGTGDGSAGPAQPDTGTPTGFTLSLALSIIVIMIIKVILKT